MIEGHAGSIRFDGQVVVVTGAGNGLGKAYALELARRGAAVVVNDLGTGADGRGASPAAADQVVEEIRQAGGIATASHASVATREGGESILDTALTHHGRIDALINNAGILRTSPFEEVSDDDLESILAANLKSIFHVTRPALGAMRRQGYGRIVMVTSASALFGHPMMSAYGASKGGVFGAVNSLALAGARDGVLCNAVAPMAFSRMAASVSEEDVRTLGGLYEQLGASMAPEYVAPLVTFLASRACQVNQAVYGAVGGCFSRIYLTQTRGWLGPRDRPATAEEVLAHLDLVENRDGSQDTRSVEQDLQRVVDLIRQG
jgi:NAD(P)-dependent dehydrogenase (short-subunit alcohol dehydrogenase family)